ncbi:MAG: hypothetical protein GY711_28970 [bacterium]|nr:hypothetical protein [bacterium]
MSRSLLLQGLALACAAGAFFLVRGEGVRGGSVARTPLSGAESSPAADALEAKPDRYRVTFETVDGLGTPIDALAKAALDLAREHPSAPERDATALIRRVSTDRDGRFEVTDLAPRAYAVSIPATREERIKDPGRASRVHRIDAVPGGEKTRRARRRNTPHTEGSRRLPAEHA